MSAAKRSVVWVLTMVVALVLCVGAQAGIVYDEPSNSIKITDFPLELPLTLERLASVDAQYGWGKVTYDAATQTCTVACGLGIGASDGTNTCVQVGTKKAPRETLVVKGNIIVYPYRLAEEPAGKAAQFTGKRINRLTLGDPNDKSITATLKIDCETKLQYGLLVGAWPADGKRVSGAGGQLHVYNSTITAATQDDAHIIGSSVAKPNGFWLLGDDFVLDGATLSWVGGFMTYGLSAANAKVVKDSTFENGGTAIVNNSQILTGCTFRNCAIAVLDWGGLNAVLTDCKFEKNARNWSLTMTNNGIVCIDCTYDTPPKGNEYKTRMDKDKKMTPTFTSKRHIIVEVVDPAGKPIPGAQVAVTCEQEGADVVENGKQTTDAAGKTPAKGGETPILLTEVIEKATDTLNQPEVTPYNYMINATADGYVCDGLRGFKPTDSWKVVRLTMKKR